MKKILFGSFLLITVMACNNTSETAEEAGFTITGNIKNADQENVVLQARVDGEWVKIDSAVVENGTFTLTGKVDQPEMQYIQVGQSRSYIGLFVENSPITVTGTKDSLNDVVVEGSKIHADYKAYSKGLEPFRTEMRALYPKYDIADSLGDKAMEAELDSIYETIYAQQVDYTKGIINNNLDNPLGPYLTSNIYYNDEKLDELEAIMATFTGNATTSLYYKQLTDKITTWKSVAIGNPAIDFEQADTTGQAIKLSSLKGKYVLIDFWASWCGPCRAENPNVVAMYKEMKDKGFEILGVSLDTSKDKWLKAIEDDGLTWPQVSDLKGWKNEVSELYGVSAIPHTVLLDKEGTIIAKNLRGDDLRKKLEEVL